MKRALWITNIQDDVSSNPPLVDNCAICRGLLTKECIECQQYSSQPARKKSTRTHVKATLMTLLMLHNRPNTVFAQLDTNVLSLIYGFSLIGDLVVSECDLAHLSCKHIYHNHCFEKWYARRSTCPLDNFPVEQSSVKRTKVVKRTFKGKLTSVVRTVHSYTEYQEENRARLFQYPAMIVSMLKRTHEGISGETLKEIIGSDITSVLDDLQRRGFVVFNCKTNRYYYN